jgi:hypothetical protein
LAIWYAIPIDDRTVHPAGEAALHFGAAGRETAASQTLGSAMTRTKRWTIGIALTALGAAMILAGWLADDKTYLSSLLLQIGSVALLVLPVLYFERVFEARLERAEADSERRVSRVRDDLETVSRSVAELRSALQDRFAAAEAADRSAVAQARGHVSFENVRDAVMRAHQVKGISAHGLRVRIDSLWQRLKVTLDDAAPGELRLSVEDARGGPIGVDVAWRQGEDVVDALASLAERWKATGEYPGDSALNAAQIVGDLLDSVELVLESRRRGGDEQLSPLIEVASEHWAITDIGLEHLGEPPYWIQAEDLTRRADEIRAHVAQKTWVREEDERAQDKGGDDFWMVAERARMFFADAPKVP